MNKEMFVSSTPRETRLAIHEEGEVAEVYYEREHEYSLAGSIYKGRVTRVLPGMQSAFVDIGLERDAFLYVSDFFEDSEEYDRVVSTVEEEAHRNQPGAAPMAAPAAGGEAIRRTAPAEPVEARSEPARGVQPSQDEDEATARRGRRRRDRRRRKPSGFPADKFASPGAPITPSHYEEHRPAEDEETDREELEAPVAQQAPAEKHAAHTPIVAKPVAKPEPRPATPAAPTSRPAQAPAAFVLPGERLAKYSSSAPAPMPTRETAGKPEPEVRQPQARQAEPSQPEARQPETKAEVKAETEPVAAVEVAPETKPEGKAEAKAEPKAETEPLTAAEAAPEIHPQPKATDTLESKPIKPASALPDNEVTSQMPTEDDPESAWYALHPPKDRLKFNPITAEIDETGIYVQPFIGPDEYEHTGTYELRLDDEESEPEPELEKLKPPQRRGEAQIAKPPAGERKTASGSREEAAQTPADSQAGKPTMPTQANPAQAGEAETQPESGAKLKTSIRSRTEPSRLQMRGRRRRRGGRGRSRGEEQPATETGGDGEEPESRPASEPASMQGNGREERAERPERAERGPRQIGELLKEGQEILVQIAKEPIGRKGARITSHLALPGRYLVYMPTVQHIGVSRRIASDEERARLKRLILENIGDLPGGFIVRTAAAGASEEEFKADMRFLGSLWSDIRQQFEKSRAPALIYHDLGLVERTLRDQLSHEFTHIWVDSEEQYQRILRFVGHFMPALSGRVRLYTRNEPMFEHFRIQEEIDRALKSKVWLKSGGYIVINQTEALVAIDVNTGKYVGKSNRLEDTIVKTNVDAIHEIVRQIRLRDLGGIIVIDFIDMDERRNRQKVMQAMEEAMRSDRAPFKLLSFNDFGLMALTRKRVKQSLERALGMPCPYCTGSGLVKSVVTVCNEIYSETRKMAGQLEREEIVLRVNPEVAKAMKSKGASYITDIEEATGKTVLVRPDPLVHQEQYEIF